MAKTLHATTALIGTIIGAGIFGIPYVVMKSGFTVGLIHILVIAFLMIITTLYLGEIALRSKENHQLTGYAEKYLGKKGKILMILSLAFGIYAAVLAYLIGVGESLSFLFFDTSNYAIYFGILTWILLSIFCHFGLKALEKGEFIGVITIIITIIAIVIYFANKIDVTNLIQKYPSTPLDYFAPFGVILFAFLGYTTIPEIKNILGKNKREMKRSILLAILICTIVYILFPAIVIGFKGEQTPQIATIALGKPFILLGVLTMLTSYLALSISLIDMFKLDFKQTKFKSWFFTCSVPIIAFVIARLTNLASFTKILGIGGVISGGLTSVLILSMINNAKILGDRKPEYSIKTSKLLTIILIIIFAIGTIAEIITTI